MEIRPAFHRISIKKSIFTSKKATVGYIVIILSSMFSGLANSFSKPLLEIDGYAAMAISPVALAAIIYLINGLFFTPLAKNAEPVKTIGKRNMFFLVLIGISEVSALILYFFGLKETSAINASILSEGEMIFSLLIAVTVLRERLKRNELTPFAMIIVGMVLIPVGYDLYNSGFSFGNIVFGDLLILFSGLCYALDINVCKYVSKRFDAKRVTQITSFVSGGFALLLMLSFNIPFNLDITQVPSILFLSIIGTGVAAFLFLISLRLIGAVRTLLIYSSSSAFGVVFSSIFLGEVITIANVFSIILVSGGIYLLRNRLADDDSTSNDSEQRPFSKFEYFIHNLSPKLKAFIVFSTRNSFEDSTNKVTFKGIRYSLGMCLVQIKNKFTRSKNSSQNKQQFSVLQPRGS